MGSKFQSLKNVRIVQEGEAKFLDVSNGYSGTSSDTLCIGNDNFVTGSPANGTKACIDPSKNYGATYTTISKTISDNTSMILCEVEFYGESKSLSCFC